MENIWKLIQHSSVLESKYLEPKFLKPLVSFIVRFNLSFMNFTIYLNDQRSRMTIEVNDKTRNNLLAPEVPSLQPVCAETLP